MSLLNILSLLALALACAMAWARAGRPERLAALALVINVALNMSLGLLGLNSGEALLSAQATLVLDIVLLAALVGIAISSKPLWTLYAGAFQLLATLTSFVRITNENLTALAYIVAQNTLWWLTMAALGFGIWDASRAKRSAAENRAAEAAP